MVSRGVISTTDDGGRTWQSQLVADDITGISCPNGHDCVAVGQDSAYQVATADGGATWGVSLLAGGAGMDGGHAPAVNGVSCVDPEHCEAVGGVFDGDEYQTPALATADGGVTWSNQATDPVAELQSVDCVTASACWAVGFTPSGSVVIHTLDGGRASPMVTGVAPDRGAFGGGTQVTVTGVGFSIGAVSVRFGAVPATGVTVVSDSELTVTAPPAAGSQPPSATVVDVTVASALGTSPVDPGDRFTYLGSAPGTPAVSLSVTAPGATCDDPPAGPAVCSGLAGGDVVDVSGTGFPPGTVASIGECSSDPDQPVLHFLGRYIPVGCSSLHLTTVAGSGPDTGDLSGMQTMVVGTVGPPVTGITPTCSDGATPIPGCTTSGDAATDAAGYPCPPTIAQAEGGDTCVLTLTDFSGGQASGILLFSSEQLPSEQPPSP